MKKGTVVSIFIFTQIGFVFLQIHKHMLFIKCSFSKQKNERCLAQLEQKKVTLRNQFYVVQNKSDIQQFAQDKLALQPSKIKQIKRVSL